MYEYKQEPKNYEFSTKLTQSKSSKQIKSEKTKT